ncbi:MAG: hypothetical protein ACPLYF_03820 [Fervidobacterium sp.]
MRRLIYIAVLLVALTFIAPIRVQASDRDGATGALRIEPHGSYYPRPVMLSSPATFNITAIDHETVYCPNILLVMTNASYQGLTGDVKVEWDGGSISFPKASFTAVSDNNASVPPSGTTKGARYKVSSLKEHIGVNGTADDTLWYAYGPFLSRPVNQTAQEFTVTLPSTNPRMLVYAIGKILSSHSLFDTCCCWEFNTKVPPTQPGFVVPDLAPVILATASFSAFGIYGIKRRKK